MAGAGSGRTPSSPRSPRHEVKHGDDPTWSPLGAVARLPLRRQGGSRSPHLDGFVFVEQGSRFLRPVAVGDTIQPRLTVERVWQEGKRRFVRLATALVNQRGETVLEGFHLYQIIPPRDAPASCPPARDRR